MQLKNLVYTIEKICKRQPNVRTFWEGDVYELNSMPSAEFGVMALTQQTHRANSEYIDYGFTLFYIDRLTSDSTNKLDAQSHGIQVLKSVLTELEDLGIYSASEWEIHTFTERFSQSCSGAYVQLTLRLDEDVCVYNYDITEEPQEDETPCAYITLQDGTTERVVFENGTIPTRAYYKRTDIVGVRICYVDKIGDQAFSECTNLSSIKIVNCPTIGKSAFYKTKASTLEMEGVELIDNGAFSFVSEIGEVWICEGCTKLGDTTCFGYSTLTAIHIPSTMEKLGSQAFEGCGTTLRNVYYNGTIEEWVAIVKTFSTFRDYNVTVHCTDGDCDKNGTQKE